MHVTYDLVSGELQLEDAGGRSLESYLCDGITLALYGQTAWRAKARRGSPRIQFEHVDSAEVLIEARSLRL